MNERILLINVHSSRNVGDAALLAMALKQLRASFPGSQFALCMDDPESHGGQEQVLESLFAWVHPMTDQAKGGWNLSRLGWLLPASLLPVLTWRLSRTAWWLLTPASLRDIVRAYLEADLVVSKPGGFLYSSGRGISLLVALYSIALAILAGKPVYILPQSIGPLARSWERWLTRRVLEGVRLVMVREPVSLLVVRACGVRNPRVSLVADMAFGFPSAEQAQVDGWLREQGLAAQQDRPLLGITVVNWGAQNTAFRRQAVYEKACQAAARWFAGQNGGQVIFFPQVWGPLPEQDDRIPARRIAEQLRDFQDAIHVVEQPIPSELLKAIYGRMDLFIGTRMHSNIFALSEGVPVVAIGYLHKTRGIAQMAGIDPWVIDIQQVDESSLVERLAALWGTRTEWREKIRATVPELIRQAERAGEMIRADYAGLGDRG